MLKNAKRDSAFAQDDVDESHLERLENLILIHIDIKPDLPTGKSR